LSIDCHADHFITTVINYCTNDYRYLQKSIEEASKFSRQILVPVCDHFFDGTEENREVLRCSYQRNPSVLFVEFAYLFDRLYSRFIRADPSDLHWPKYWHSTARYAASFFVDPKTEYVLFLDVDEIADGDRFLEWLGRFPYRDYDGLRLLSYYYFRDASFRAKQFQNQVLFMKKKAIVRELMIHPWERKGMFLSIEGKKRENMPGIDQRPLFHHYSWVKTKEESLKKGACWGHSREKKWVEIIENEFTNPIFKSDFMFQLEYETVCPFFDPLTVFYKKTEEDGAIGNVVYVNDEILFKKSLMEEFSIAL
jgi:hypothetical protein